MKTVADLNIELEELMFQYADHDIQMHEIVGQQFTWALSHCPSLLETYLDGTTPAPYEAVARRILTEE